ncbi:MAG: hypothetical protein R3C97_04425 [Geminicoccaceae bacterium]
MMIGSHPEAMDETLAYSSFLVVTRRVRCMAGRRYRYGSRSAD